MVFPCSCRAARNAGNSLCDGECVGGAVSPWPSDPRHPEGNECDGEGVGGAVAPWPSHPRHPQDKKCDVTAMINASGKAYYQSELSFGLTLYATLTGNVTEAYYQSAVCAMC